MKRNGTSTAFTLAGFLLMLFIWTGCEKDKFETGHDLKAKIYSPISVTEAQNYFRSLDLAVVNTLDGDHKFLNINPVWDSAFVSHAQSGREIVIVPIADSVLLQANEGRANAKLIFSKKGADSILVNILLYCADSAYYAATNGNINFNTFSGVYSFFDIGQNFKYAVYVKDGVPKSGTDTLHHSTSQSIEDRACYTYVIYYYLCPPAQTVLLEADCWHFISFHWCDNFGDPGSGNGGSGNGGNGGNGGSGGGNGGGGGGNNNNTPVNIFDEEVGFLEVFTDAIPLDVFLEKGGKLPAGINAAKARQLVEINDLLDLPIEQIKWLSTHGSLIPTIRNNINNPELRVKMKQLLELATRLNLTGEQVGWLLTNTDKITESFAFATSKNFDIETQTAVKLMIDLASQNQLPIDADSPIFQQIFSEYPELSQDLTIDPGIEWLLAFSIERAQLKWDHPTWSDWYLSLSAAWNVSKEGLHTALDGLGLVPGIGEVADLTNGLFYTLQGDYTNGSLSVASAVPFAGWVATGTKYAKKTINGAKVVWHIDDVGKITFGNRNQLAKVLKTVGTGKQAHHLIPWEHLEHNVIQAAAKKSSLDPFNMNELANGLALSEVQHLGSHQAYNNAVFNRLNEIESQWPNISPELAVEKCRYLADKLKDIISQHPNNKVSDPEIVNLIYQIQF